MNPTFRNLAAAFAVAVLAGCSSERMEPVSRSQPIPTDAQAKFDLGRDFCGNCVAGVRKHLANVAGVGEVDYVEGAKDFTIHFDSKLIDAPKIAAKLVASGEEGAKVLP
ncbi:MAG: hypothetical protein JNL12_01350 [Planctomycetes bacterium]|nr:hypothetical protein [Planctomycetota bacterium]